MIRSEKSEIENGKTKEELEETKSWFSEEINKINKLSGRQTKKERETYMTKIRKGSGDITTNLAEIKNYEEILSEITC